MESTSLLLLTLFLIYFVWKLSTIASRLDRTHRRRDAALNSLRQYLAIRATATAKLITSGSLETNVAARLRSDLENVMNESEKSFNAYLIAESKLTGALCEEFDDDNQILPLLGSTKTADLVFELVRASKRVQLARRFHNDAVGASQLLHKRFVVRLFRLAGHTPAPKAVDLDDRVPASFQNL
jgi:hypothetical protein